MVRIYIRHADKEYEKGEGFSFKHDPPITQDGVVQSRKMARDRKSTRLNSSHRT